MRERGRGWEGVEKGREESEGRRGGHERKTEGGFPELVPSNPGGHTAGQGGVTVFKSASFYSPLNTGLFCSCQLSPVPGSSLSTLNTLSNPRIQS